jgi:hypothetical protein
MGEFSSESSALLGVCPLPRASSFVGQGAGCGDCEALSLDDFLGGSSTQQSLRNIKHPPENPRTSGFSWEFPHNWDRTIWWCLTLGVDCGLMWIVIHDLTVWVAKSCWSQMFIADLMIDMIVHAATPQIYKSQDISLFLSISDNQKIHRPILPVFFSVFDSHVVCHVALNSFLLPSGYD